MVLLWREKYCILAIKILSGFIFFLPLFSLSSFYFPFIVPRNLGFRVLVEILILLYFLLIIQNPSYIPRKNRIWIFLLAFFSSLTFSSILGGDFLYSFWSNYERMDGLAALYHQCAYFFVLYSILKTKKEWEILMQVSIFASLIIALVGLSQVLKINMLLASSGGERISSTLGNPTYLSAYLLIHIFIASYFLLKKREYREYSDMTAYTYGFVALDSVIAYIQFAHGSKEFGGILHQIFSHQAFWIPFMGFHILAYSLFFKKYLEKFFPYIHAVFYSTVIIFYLFLISYTQTRGAFVGLGLGIIFGSVVIFFMKELPKAAKIGGGIAIFLMLASILFIFTNTESPIVKNNPIFSKISTISLDDTTTQSRLETWKASLKGLFDRPIFGWGAENFYRVFDTYFPPKIYTDQNAVVWFDRPHNMMFQYLVEGGVVGAGLYFLFLGSLVYYLLKHVRGMTGIFFSVFTVSYIGQNLFVFDSINSYIPFYFLLGFMLFLIEEKVAFPEIFAKEKWRKSVAWLEKHFIAVVSVGILLTFSMIWHTNIIPARANIRFIQQYASINSNSDKDDYENLLATLDQAPYIGKLDLISLTSEKAILLARGKNLRPDELSEIVQKTEKYVVEMLNRHPNDIRRFISAMVFYMNTSSIDSGNIDKALALRERAKTLSPTRAPIYLMTGKAYMAKEARAQAIADFRKAEKLAPWIFEPHYNLLGAYIKEKDLNKAREEIQEILGLQNLLFEEYKKVMALSILAELYPEAEKITLKAIKVFPKKAELYAALADIFVREKKTRFAIVAIQKAISLDPQYKEKGELLLQELKGPPPPAPQTKKLK